MQMCPHISSLPHQGKKQKSKPCICVGNGSLSLSPLPFSLCVSLSLPQKFLGEFRGNNREADVQDTEVSKKEVYGSLKIRLEGHGGNFYRLHSRVVTYVKNKRRNKSRLKCWDFSETSEDDSNRYKVIYSDIISQLHCITFFLPCASQEKFRISIQEVLVFLTKPRFLKVSIRIETSRVLFPYILQLKDYCNYYCNRYRMTVNYTSMNVSIFIHKPYILWNI